MRRFFRGILTAFKIDTGSAIVRSYQHKRPHRWVRRFHKKSQRLGQRRGIEFNPSKNRAELRIGKHDFFTILKDFLEGAVAPFSA